MSLTHFRLCYFVKKDYKKINKETIFHFENHVFLKSIVEKHLSICNMRSCNPTEKCIKGSSINHVYMQGGKSKFILIHKPYLVKCSRNGGMGVKKAQKLSTWFMDGPKASQCKSLLPYRFFLMHALIS